MSSWQVEIGFGAQDLGLDLEIMSVSPKKFPYQFTSCREHPADPHWNLSPFCPHIASFHNSVGAHINLLGLP